MSGALLVLRAEFMRMLASRAAWLGAVTANVRLVVLVPVAKITGGSGKDFQPTSRNKLRVRSKLVRLLATLIGSIRSVGSTAVSKWLTDEPLL